MKERERHRYRLSEDAHYTRVQGRYRPGSVAAKFIPVMKNESRAAVQVKHSSSHSPHATNTAFNNQAIKIGVFLRERDIACECP